MHNFDCLSEHEQQIVESHEFQNLFAKVFTTRLKNLGGHDIMLFALLLHHPNQIVVHFDLRLKKKLFCILFVIMYKIKILYFLIVRFFKALIMTRTMKTKGQTVSMSFTWDNAKVLTLRHDLKYRSCNSR